MLRELFLLIKTTLENIFYYVFLYYNLNTLREGSSFYKFIGGKSMVTDRSLVRNHLAKSPCSPLKGLVDLFLKEADWQNKLAIAQKLSCASNASWQLLLDLYKRESGQNIRAILAEGIAKKLVERKNFLLLVMLYKEESIWHVRLHFAKYIAEWPNLDPDVRNKIANMEPNKEIRDILTKKRNIPV